MPDSPEGTFADWQPQYAARGIATFPVEITPGRKKPAISHWQKVGLRGSSRLATKFAGANAFGFQCGKHSRITVVDIDRRDEHVVGEAVKLFGESPILWRTGGGKFAMPFRWNGDARQIRPIASLPIDILGGATP